MYMLRFFPLPVIPISLFYCLHFLQDHKEHNLIIDRHGKDNKTLKLSNINLEENLIDPLTGFYAITVKDYVNSFFRKGEKNVLGYQRRTQNSKRP